jgi:hypothetical protein
MGKSNFTYQRTGNQPVDLAMQLVAQAFARVDQTPQLNVVQVNVGTYAANGSEDIIVVNRSGRVSLPSPTTGWTVTIVQGGKAQTVSITTASPSVPFDGDTPGVVTLSEPYSSAQVTTDGAAYYVVGGSAAGPVIPPIPPFPPIPPQPVPPPGPPVPATATTQWPFQFGLQNTLISTPDGVEHVAEQFPFPGDQLPAGLLALVCACQGQSTSGTGTLRVRVGGTDGGVDGAVVATFTAATSGFTQAEVAQFFSNPGILTYLKVTTQGSGAGQKTTFKNGVATVR